MAKLTITDIEKLKDKDIKNMSGEVEFSSAVSMGMFVKKIRKLSLNYTADYAKFSINFN
jgi:hypothetical protein